MADEKKPFHIYGWDVGVEPDRTVYIATNPTRRDSWVRNAFEEAAIERQRQHEKAMFDAYAKKLLDACNRTLNPPTIPAPQYNRDVLAEALQYVIDNTNSQAQLDRAKAELAKVEGK